MAPYIEISSYPWKFLCHKSIVTNARPLKRSMPSNRLFQLVVPETCFNKPLPFNGFKCHNTALLGT
jgi:hypothetical protein